LFTPLPLPIVSSSDTLFNNEFINSSLLNTVSLHATNSALNELINTEQPLHTLIRMYVYQLINTIERLWVKISILQKEKKNLENILNTHRK
jgi:hypothetical protein